MEVRRGKVGEDGSCNYCNKGKRNERNTLDYPYEEILILYGRNVSTHFCEECFDELKKVDAKSIQF